ncbi:MerR family transcriptional regulator [Cohnella abietis]|uniref:Transcriptional regulator n=1 Tax=Cohnella abietis TaxID=2507935 RepID=A0A3T1DAW7_9BACL|nr:MerR family transcriptional regulator [Cohnella abietis]BBI35223.1 transcriptional regulator [Cohnella abietis]
MKLSIGEASEILACPASTIRYYEKEGLLPLIQRDQSGKRYFTQTDLDWIKLITCFRATGMKLVDLKKIVELSLQGEETIPERKKILKEHQKELHRKQTELNKAFEAILHKLNIYDHIEQERITSPNGIYQGDNC